MKIMRLLRKIQRALIPVKIEYDRAEELEAIGDILSELPGISDAYQRVLQDLVGDSQSGSGAGG
jgi:hypothetical protein